jgi:hypothetical protein
MTGVEHDQVGVDIVGRGGQAFGGQQFGHALAIIGVHLAAEALDPVGLRECLLGRGRHGARR